MTTNLAVHLASVTKRFGALTAVDHVDLDIPAGQVLALLGPNGAGKSTTTEMILGLAKPDAGQITVFGRSPDDAVRAGVIGAMLQNGVLLDGTTVGGLLSSMRGLYAHPLPLAEIIERAGVSGFLKTRTEKLSGGQRQRVRFALALMADPDFIILDEPTVGLDVDARRQFWATMHDFAETGRTVMFATHYLDEADEFADRVVVMAHGRVVADGTGSEIKSVVAGRVISFTCGQQRDWAGVPGATAATVDGHRVALTCTDSDRAVRALVAHDDVRDIEITTPSLEDAFLEITKAA